MGETLTRERRPEAWVVLGCALLYLIITFFEWQHFTVVNVTTVEYGFNAWHGVGVIPCVLVIALIAWEIARLFGLSLPWASLSAAFVSLALAVLLFLFTVLTFLSRSDGLRWPAWMGLGLSMVIAVTAVARAKAEGVEMLRLTPTPKPTSVDRVVTETLPEEESR